MSVGDNTRLNPLSRVNCILMKLEKIIDYELFLSLNPLSRVNCILIAADSRPLGTTP